MARLQQPQIVLHNSGQDGTLRSAASARGIRAITVEIGNPQLFQSQYVQVSCSFANLWANKHIYRFFN
jgi:predicted deacylase